MPRMIFISHAADDLPVVKLFVDYILKLGFSVPPNQIFCSSYKGLGVTPGKSFKQRIESLINPETLFLAVLSDNYYASPYCLCELGAGWIQCKDPLPLVIGEPITSDEIKVVMAGIHGLAISNEKDLDQLKDVFKERTSYEPHSSPEWTGHKEDFLKLLPVEVAKIATHAHIPREVHDRALLELAEYKCQYSELRKENGKLKELNDRISKEADSRTIKKIILESMPDKEVFETLCGEANRCLSRISSVTRRAIYFTYIDDIYDPLGEEGEEAASAKRAAELTFKDDEGFIPNRSKRIVKEAIEAVEKIKDWFENSSPEGFSAWYEEEYGEPFDLKSEGFWSEHLS